MKAKSIILGFSILLAAQLDPHLLESLCSAEAGVSIAVLNQSVDVLVVDAQSLTLEVGAERTLLWTAVKICLTFALVHRARSFVPGEASPLQHINDVLC